MTGSPTWLAIGLLCLVGGLFLIFLTLRRRPRRRCLRSAATLLRGKISASPTLIDIARATDRLGIIGQLLHRPSIAVGIAEEHE